MTFVTDALLVDGSVDRERFAELMCSSAASSRFVVGSFAVSIFEDKLVIVNSTITTNAETATLSSLFNLHISCGSIQSIPISRS